MKKAKNGAKSLSFDFFAIKDPIKAVLGLFDPPFLARPEQLYTKKALAKGLIPIYVFGF
ncbi:hypothetical protein [Maribacter sp. 2304DJ31-5]|uniref:hypothetical protein n=1 Tax=Maribacter sp. 2304DJ31-5 TaxID=3386273 RepID=UPI0039BC72C3